MRGSGLAAHVVEPDGILSGLHEVAAVPGRVFTARIPHHLTGERRRDVERTVGSARVVGGRSARVVEPVVADGAPDAGVQDFEPALIGGVSIDDSHITVMGLPGSAGSPLGAPRPDTVPVHIAGGADLNLVPGPGGEPGDRGPRDRHVLGAVLPGLCVDDAVAHVVAVNVRRIGRPVMRLAPLDLELGRASRLHRRSVQPGFRRAQAEH